MTYMYWPNFRLPTVHKQQSIFEKTLTEVYRSHLHASFSTFCVQIGQLLEAQWPFIFARIQNQRHVPSKMTICPCSNILQRLTVLRKIDQFERKRCQMKHGDLDNKLLSVFFQKCFVLHEWWAVKNLFITYIYICYAPCGLFWTVL